MAEGDPTRATLLTTTDPVRLGRFWCGAAAFFAVVGGLEAMALRVQGTAPAVGLLSGEGYAQLLTLHGTTMALLALLPFWAGLAFALVPLQIGARSLAFPRLAALSVWLWLAGALLFHAWLPLGGFGAAPAFGWTGSPVPPAGIGAASWLVGAGVASAALVLAATNLVTTVVRLRAPGMGPLRVPAFTHATFWAQVLVAFVLSGVAWSAFLLALEMALVPAPVEEFPDWTRLVRLGAHPEVWVFVLPALGVVGDVVATFGGRRPLSGPLARVAIAALALLGLASLATGAGTAAAPAWPLATGIVAALWVAATMLDVAAALPQLRWRAPVGYALFALAALAAGGALGLAQAGLLGTSRPGSAATVGHFHLLLSGAALLGAFAATALWWPKLTGRVLGERLGWLHAVLTALAVAVGFGALATAGAMPRGAARVAAEQWSDAATLASLGAFALAGALIAFLWNAVASRTRPAPADPWDGGTLEWATPTPLPAARFERSPRVADAFPLWQEKRETRAQDRWQRHWGPRLAAASMPRAAVAPFLAAASLASLGLALGLAAARAPGPGGAICVGLAFALAIAGGVLWLRTPASVPLRIAAAGDGARDVE